MKKETKITIITIVVSWLVIGSIFGYLKHTETNGIFIGRLDYYETYGNGSCYVFVSHFDGKINHSKVFNECWITVEEFNKYMGKNMFIQYYVKDNYTIAKYIELDTNEY